MDTLLTLPEAAAALGISLAAVRKRRQRGILQSVRRDGRWYVRLGQADEVDKPEDRGQVHQRPLSTDIVPRLEEEIAFLRRGMEAKDMQLAGKDQQIAELHILLQRALERQPVLELPAATRPIAEPFTEPAHTEAPLEPKQERRGFWAWLRAGAPHGG